MNCEYWTRYWRLAMLLARPALAVATVFTFLAWDEFAWALTVIFDGNEAPVADGCSMGQNSAVGARVCHVSYRDSRSSSYLVFQRHFVAGLTAGAEG